jgi:hypothetical protein
MCNAAFGIDSDQKAGFLVLRRWMRYRVVTRCWKHPAKQYIHVRETRQQVDIAKVLTFLREGKAHCRESC